MAITATFAADFTQFVASTKTAEASLAKLEGQGTKLGTTLERTQSNSDRFRGSLQSFDGVLASLGVNIGAEVRALGELSTAAGTTATELGLIATVGLAAGAALAGWQIGKQVDEWTGLSQSIASGTAALLGWGDVAEQTMGAKWDVITRAVKNGAAATISYSDAIVFNTAVNQKRLSALTATKKAQDDIATSMIELNSVGVGWQGTLNTINGSVVEAIKFYLAAGVSQSELATAYGLTAAQVKAVASALTDETAALGFAEAASRSLADFKDTALARQIEILKAQAAEQFTTAGVVNAAIQAELDARIELNASFGLDAQGRQKMTSAAETLRQGLEALHSTKVEGIAQTAQEQVLYAAYTKTVYDSAVATDSAVFSQSRVPAVANAAAAAINGVTSSYWAQVDAAMAAHNADLIAAGLQPIPSIGHRPPSLEDPGFSSGGFSGGGLRPLTGLHPLANAGGGSNVVNHFYVNGTAQDIAKQTAETITRTLMQSSKLVPR